MSLAQQGVSSFTVEFGFGANATDYTVLFTDVTQYVRSVSVTRGKTDDLQDFSAGTATIVLDNRDRRFDPTYTSGPHYGFLLPRVRVRISLVDQMIVSRTLFSGFVSGWPQSYGAYGKDATVEVQCFDLLALVSQVEMPTDPSQAVVLSYATPAISRFYRFGDWTDQGDTVYDTNNAQNMFVTVGPGGSGSPIGTNTVGPELAPELNGTSSFLRGTVATTGFSTVLQATGSGSYPPTVQSVLFGGWIRIDANTVNYAGLGAGIVRLGNFAVGLGGTGNSRLLVQSTTGTTLCTGTTNIVDGIAHHIIVFFNNATQRVNVYVDGVLDTATNIALGVPSYDTISFNSIYTESYVQDWFFFFNGESVISQFASTPTVLSTLYGAGFNEAEMSTFDRYQLLINLASMVYPSWFTAEPSADYIADCLQLNIEGKSLLQALQDVARTEQGFLFAKREGDITFLPRYHIAETILGNPVMTFTDDPTLLPTGIGDLAGLTHTGYMEFGYDYDDAQLVNNFQVVVGSGDSAFYEDAGSVTALAKRSQTIDTLLGSTSEAQDMAEGLTNIYKNIELRLREMHVKTVNDFQASILSGIEIGNLIATRRLPQGIGSPIQEYLTVLQIRHELTPSSWDLYLYASARPVNTFFILDDSELDGPEVLGF